MGQLDVSEVEKTISTVESPLSMLYFMTPDQLIKRLALNNQGYQKLNVVHNYFVMKLLPLRKVII